MNETLNSYLEIVESHLVKNIQNNFDFFTESFNNFDGMREQMGEIRDKAKNLKEFNQRMVK